MCGYVTMWLCGRARDPGFRSASQDEGSWTATTGADLLGGLLPTFLRPVEPKKEVLMSAEDRIEPVMTSGSGPAAKAKARSHKLKFVELPAGFELRCDVRGVPFCSLYHHRRHAETAGCSSCAERLKQVDGWTQQVKDEDE